MKRWNGWGNVDTDYPVPPSALEYLTKALGPLTLSLMPPKRPFSPLYPHPASLRTRWWILPPKTRLTHARGQSMHDWVDMRHGRVDTFPDGVAFPASGEDVRALLKYAREAGAAVIPYGGGTSVVGHINPSSSDAPVLTLSLEKMTSLIDLDETSRLATFQAGVAGPQLEEQLKAHGYTLGHFPQSFEYSTLGGWIVTRSSGQQSYRYGKIEQLFAGGMHGNAARTAGDQACPGFGCRARCARDGARVGGQAGGGYAGSGPRATRAGDGVLLRGFLPVLGAGIGCGAGNCPK